MEIKKIFYREESLINICPHESFLVRVESVGEFFWLGVWLRAVDEVGRRRMHDEFHCMSDASRDVFFESDEIGRRIELLVGVGRGRGRDEPSEHSRLFAERVNDQRSDLCVVLLAAAL